MPAAVYLFVDRPVASLQFDLETVGQATSMLDASANKFLNQGRQTDGKLRVIIFGLGQETFSGRIASVDAPVTGISGVIGANPDGSNAGAGVIKISKPEELSLMIL